MTHDLVVAGGRLLDPARGLDETGDLGIDGDRIAAAGGALEGAVRLDARGLLVVPGLVDLHVHVYEGVSHYGIDADRYLLARGTTTGVDTGSAGARTLHGFRRYVVEAQSTRIVAYLNLAAEGMISPHVGELVDLRWASVDDCVAAADANRDLVVGVKLRAGWQMVGDDPRPALVLAREAADALELPLMVHIIDMEMPLPELLAQLRPRDVVTHCFHGSAEGSILDENGRVWPEVFAAAEAGVAFDIGHGVGSFSFRVARAALEQGFLPTTISSDIHTYNHEFPVVSLPRTMSKLLHLGVPLERVVEMATAAPAALIEHVAAGLGSLAPGAPADVTLLALDEEPAPLHDAAGETEQAAARLVPRAVVRAGHVYACTEPA